MCCGDDDVFHLKFVCRAFLVKSAFFFFLDGLFVTSVNADLVEKALLYFNTAAVTSYNRT